MQLYCSPQGWLTSLAAMIGWSRLEDADTAVIWQSTSPSNQPCLRRLTSKMSLSMQVEGIALRAILGLALLFIGDEKEHKGFVTSFSLPHLLHSLQTDAAPLFSLSAHDHLKATWSSIAKRCRSLSFAMCNHFLPILKVSRT